jgi:glycosyltransferase involved in cell wall biosynthesis
MPAFNEGEGIKGFLLEIRAVFHDSINFIVVDDRSTDDTFAKLNNFSQEITVEIIQNDQNLGHGPSTLRALQAGLDSGCDTIIAVDGDGQFSAEEIFGLYEFFSVNNFDVAEGVRRIRLNEPWFRSSASFFTRQIVRMKSNRMPQDANTPLRIYKAECLEKLFDKVVPLALTPNLMISIVCRISDMSIGEFHVTFFPRRGSSSVGESWNQKFRVMPSSRFLKFCIHSVIQLLRFKPTPIEL